MKKNTQKSYYTYFNKLFKTNEKSNKIVLKEYPEFNKTYEDVQKIKQDRKQKTILVNYKQHYDTNYVPINDKNIIKKAQIQYIVKVVNQDGTQSNKKHQITIQNVPKTQLYDANFIEKIINDYYDTISYPQLQQIISNQIIDVIYKDIREIKMKQYAYLDKEEYGNLKLIFTNKDQCVYDYLRYELSTVQDYNLNKSILNNDEKLMQIFDAKHIREGVSINQFINIKDYFRVNIYIFDPTGVAIYKHQCKDSIKSLVFSIDNEHIYPIIDSKKKNEIIKLGRINMNKEQSHFEYTNQEDFYYMSQQEIDNINYSNLPQQKVLLFDNNEYKIEYLLRDYIKQTNQIPFCKVYNGELIAFYLPESNHIIEQTTDFNIRKNMLNDLHNEYELPCFEFVNQSYTQISKTIFNSMFGQIDLMRSQLNENQWQLFDSYSIKPYIKKIFDPSLAQKCNLYSFDISKSYTNVLKSANFQWNIFTQYDDVQQYYQTLEQEQNYNDLKPGEYYINSQIKLSESIILPNGWYPHNMVIYLLQNKIIIIQDITYQMIASKLLKNDVFVKFIKYICEKYPQQSKILINSFTGDFGKKYNKRDNFHITDSHDTLMALLYLQEERGYDCRFDFYRYTQEHQDKDLYYLKSTQKQKCLDDSMLPIYRQIISQGIIQLHQLQKTVLKHNKNALVVSLNTDSIVICTKNVNTNFVKDIEDTPLYDQIGQYRYEEPKVKGHILRPELEINEQYKYYQKQLNIIQENESDEFMNNNQSCFIDEEGGYGKSYLAIKTFNQQTLYLAPSNNAIQELIRKCQKMNKDYDLKQFNTLDKFFFLYRTKAQQQSFLTSYNRIIIDEYTMISKNMMNKLYNLKNDNKHLKFVFLGDHNQIPPIGDDQYKHYMNTEYFKQLCDYNRIKLTYKQETARYDNQTRKILQYVLKNKKLPEEFKDRKINPELQRNISKLRQKTLEPLNEQFFKKYNNEYYVGQRLLCKENKPDMNIYNNQVFIIQTIDDYQISLQLNQTDEIVILNQNQVKQYFDLGYCNTIFCEQGSTINEQYNIYDIEQMNINELYTALSRCNNINQVYFNYTDKTFKPFFTKRQIEIQLEAQKDNKFKNGKIYQITYGDHRYIGQTIGTLQNRLKQHLNDAFKLKDKFHQFIRKLNKSDHKDMQIELLCNYPCQSQIELSKKEEQMIKELKPNLNTIHTKEDNLEEQNKKQIIQQRVIQKQKQIQFNISENENEQCYYISGYVDKKRIKTKVRFGKNKQQAYEKAQQKQKQFEEQYVV